MSDQTEVKGISDEERDANKAIYVGKQLYAVMVELKTVLHKAGAEDVKGVQLGEFADLDVDAYIEEARRIGQVPVWNAEATPVGKKLTYPKGTTGVNA